MWSSDAENKFYFKENYSELIKERITMDNAVATYHIKTNLFFHYLIASKLVAEVVFVVKGQPPFFLKRGSILCILSYLGQEYSIVMENDGMVVRSYIDTQQVVDHNYPLFLIISDDVTKES